MEHIILLTDRGRLTTTDPVLDILVQNRLYKTLSLFSASQVGVLVPKSVLILGKKNLDISGIIDNWQRPYILRMDYGIRPTRKFQGGIPITSEQSLAKILVFLLNKGFYPLLHPYFDRFHNQYSAGILLTPENSRAHVEVVGTGFDASDLRLGIINPHERFEADLLTGNIENHTALSQREYERSRETRAFQIASFRNYIQFVNQNAELLCDQHQLSPTNDEVNSARKYLPITYKMIPEEAKRSLLHIALLLQSKVLPTLPFSNSFVASLSLFKRQSWVLWDIYGGWYHR